MHKLGIFYHVYPGNDWEYMFQEQIGSLYLSGLIDVSNHFHIGFNDDISLLPDHVQSFAKTNSNQQEETDTLRDLVTWCKENPDANVLYMHTKGVSKKTRYTEDWRHSMEYFCIHNWKQCVEALANGYEVAGINWQEETSMGYYPHFSGGFWWAKASYVAVNCDEKYFDHPNRYMREFFIGSGKPEAKNFWESRLNRTDKAMHYTQPYDKKIYSNTYLNESKPMNVPYWETANPEIAELLVNLDINGFDSEGGTDKNTIHNFTGIYAYLLDQYRDCEGRLLEIGIQHGGSSLLWHEYLPEFYLDLVDTQDIVPDKIWHNMDPERYDFYQADAYCKSAVDEFGQYKYDVIIDDGPHTLHTQKFSVEHYYPMLKRNGVLIIEDIQNIAHLDELTNLVPESDRSGIRVFDVRETKGRYDDLIWAIIKE
jgi:hypothetical protein